MEEKQFDLAQLKKVGMIQQKQKDYFAMRLRAVGGDLTADELIKIAEIAKKYGKGQVHLSTRQGVEIHYVHYKNLEKAREELEKAGIRMGACGPRIRVVVACPGDSTCKWGIVDTKEIAKYLDGKYFCEDTPHKFKLGVTGCPHNCAKATENDIGVMGGIFPKWEKEKCIDCNLCVAVCPTQAISKKGEDYILDENKCIYCSICTSLCPVNAWIINQRGYLLTIGGTMGKIPRLGSKIGGLILEKEKLYELIDKSLRYYQKNGRKKERFGHMIDRVGLDYVKEEILNG